MAALCGAEPTFAQQMTVKQEPIPDEIWANMQGKSWHQRLANAKCARAKDCQCPPRESLVLLSVPYLDFKAQPKLGRLIVARSVADEVGKAFTQIFESRQFQIQRMELVDVYGGDDDASMAANNTSAFNCRLTTNGTRLSAHASGEAIDINPVQNPYVRGSTTLPPAGKAFDEPAERSAKTPGLITSDQIVVKAFDAQGWKWGGNWQNSKDYQHFSKDGR